MPPRRPDIWVSRRRSAATQVSSAPLPPARAAATARDVQDAQLPPVRQGASTEVRGCPRGGAGSQLPVAPTARRSARGGAWAPGPTGTLASRHCGCCHPRSARDPRGRRTDDPAASVRRALDRSDELARHRPRRQRSRRGPPGDRFHPGQPAPRLPERDPRRDYAHVSLVPLDAPTGPRVSTGLVCERVHFARRPGPVPRGRTRRREPLLRRPVRQRLRAARACTAGRRADVTRGSRRTACMAPHPS